MALESLFAAQKAIVRRGYGQIMNDVIALLLQTTSYTRVYVSSENQRRVTPQISKAKNYVYAMLGYTEKGQVDYYQETLRELGSKLRDLASSIERAKEMEEIGRKLRTLGFILDSADVSEIASTIEETKSQVNPTRLEELTKELGRLYKGGSQATSYGAPINYPFK